MSRSQRQVPKESPLTKSLAAQIVEYCNAGGLSQGGHVSAQELADRLGVSRNPISLALAVLAEKGVFRHEPHKGYFLAVEAPIRPESLGLERNDHLKEIYFQVAEDLLRGAIPVQVSENFLRTRYGLSAAQLKQLLNRMTSEGWLERRQGYGWQFSAMLTTADSLVQTYRMRAALEPAALLEPGFHVDQPTLNRLAETELALLDGRIETISTDALYDRGVIFHETLAEASGNPFILDALRRVNRVRRLLAYRSMSNRDRYYKQAREHLEILELLRHGHIQEASVAMHHHISTVIVNLNSLDHILGTDKPELGTTPRAKVQKVR
jgi:DNA-binding GntR family transcriptional regulator